MKPILIDNYRFEGEFRYLRNKIKNDTATDGENDFNVKAHWNTYAYMANAYFDFDQFSEQHIRPFIGVGAGYARVTAAIKGGGATIKTPFNTFNTFAYQVMPGIAYDFDDHISANIAYRYLGTS